MSLTTNEMSAADIAAVTGANRGYGDGFGGDGWWIILFLILAMGGNWGNNGFGGGGSSIPWFMNTDNDVERGFDQMSTMNGINALQSTVSNGFANTATQLCNGFAGVEQGANARQMADMNQNFALQTAMMQGFNNIGSQFADCCCENRLGIADLKYTVATENCADRTQSMMNTRDIIDAQTSSTQAILDKLCQLELDGVKRQLYAKNDRISELQNQLNIANFKESQTEQNAFIAQGLTNEVDALYNRLNNCPVSTVPVYGKQPIFSCQNNGCGCGTGCGCGM